MENLVVNVKNFHHRKYTKKLDSHESENYYPNEETIKAIEEAEKGIGLSRTFDTVEELMRDLMSNA